MNKLLTTPETRQESSCDSSDCENRLSSQIVLELRNKRNNPRNSEGAFITLSDGRLMFAYSRYYGSSWSDNGQATISARFSSDGGLSWSKRDKLLLANEGGHNVMSPSLLRLDDGRIAFFYLRTNNFHDCRMYLRLSSDEGRTWSDPRLCIAAPGYFIVNNDRVIQLSSGRLIIPAAYHRPKRDDGAEDWAGWDYRAITLFYYSDDRGQTWSESSDWWSLPVRSRSGMQEPGLIELADGTLYAWARTDTGRQWHMVSTDSGIHWSPPRASGFRSPNASMSIKRIPGTGKLIAIWNDHGRRWKLPPPVLSTGFGANSSWGRTPLAMAISTDEGRSWGNFKLLEDDPRRGFCYTAIHFTDDALLLAYCCGGVENGVLQETRIRRIRYVSFDGTTKTGDST